MKKLVNKIFLILAVFTLIVPSANIYAIEGEEEPGSTPSPTEPSETPTPTPEEPEETGSPTTPEESEGGSSTPTPTPTPNTPTPDARDSEAYLESLSVAGVKFNKNFDRNTTSYSATVKSTVGSVNVSAKAAGTAKVIGGTGYQTLRDGTTTLEVKVQSKDETQIRTYTIKITKATDNLNLKSLKIKGQSLNEEFSKDVLEYTADVPFTVEDVTIVAAADDANASFTVTGNTNLKVGKNIVRVTVKNQTGDTKEYKIVVTRGTEEELLGNNDDDGNNVVSSSSEVTSPVIGDSASSDNPNKGNTLKYVLIVIFCILLLAIAGLGIYFYMKTGDSESRKKRKIEKLKKKQDRINEELTGLIPVIPTEQAAKEEHHDTDQEFEDTIEMDTLVVEDDDDDDDMFDDLTKEIKTFKEVPKKEEEKNENVLEDFDDLFLDD